jgi:guanylate kinase
MQRLPAIRLAVSATTRAPRAGERHGVEYHFLTPLEFRERREHGDFVEDVDYAGASYGTLRSELEDKAASGSPVVLEIEVQGARQVRRALPAATQIFIAPPSLEELRRRLRERGTDDPEKVERRLGVAQREIAAREEFAYVVVNDELQRALDELESIVRRELGEGQGAPARA